MPGVLTGVIDKYKNLCYILATLSRANKPHGGRKEMENGLNAVEVQELKAALLKAERLELLVILYETQSIEEAISAIKQRIKA